jgi:uncharacterized C2H2 Zn-finger protein
MFVVMILRSLRHRSCVVCGLPLDSLDDSSRHWHEVFGWDFNETKREARELARRQEALKVL